jgi:hypothetical protein
MRNEIFPFSRGLFPKRAPGRISGMGELLTLPIHTTQKTPASERPDRGFSYTKCLFAEAGLSAPTAIMSL